MKKFLIAVLALSALSFGVAHSFTVGADYYGGLGITAQYHHDFDFGALVVGARVLPTSFATELVLGVSVDVFVIEAEDTAYFAVPVLLHVPVYDGDSFALSGVDVSAGLEMFVPTETGFGLVFNAAARSSVGRELVTQWPSLYVGAGVRFAF